MDLETPRTEAGNATFMTNSHDLEDFSVENSFIAPPKNGDLLQHMRNGRGLNLKTPRTRNPLADRRNLPNGPKPGEFTPLLKSVAKKNFIRGNATRGVPQTPAFLKESYKGGDTPALPASDSSRIYGEETGSLGGGEDDGTPVPHVASSSAQSTPLALPQRDSGGVLTAEGNALTLREQENIINKIEKENFGLKLKIHFLDETLKKAGPGYNAAALKENTDLKVDKITMQKELALAKKTLLKTERELGQYRLHLQEVQKDVQRKHLNAELQKELETLRDSVAAKDHELERLHQKTSTASDERKESEKLRADIDDLEADLREKDRLIEDRDDEIDRLKEKVNKDSDELTRVHDQLEDERQRLVDLQEDQEDHDKLANQLKEVQEDLKEALDAKQKAEGNLELQEEMSNKSLHTKGLSWQLEDKANKLKSDLAELRSQHTDLQNRFDDKSRELKRAQDSTQVAKQDAGDREQRLHDQNELLHHDHEIATRKCESLTKEVQKLGNELRAKSEDKDLLHSRHDALTIESKTLQNDLVRAQSKIRELEGNLEDEKQHALSNDRQLRTEAQHEVDRLSEEVENLRRGLEDRISQYNADQDHWESQYRDVQSQKERSDERAAGLQRTVNKLQETEGTLSGRETKLQQALESEKERHRSEEAVLERQIQELNLDINEKREALEDVRSELSQTNEELRIRRRERSTYEERIQGLEDEVEVLQTGLDEESERAKMEIEKAQREVNSLRSQSSISKQELKRAETAHGSSEGLDSQIGELNTQLEMVKSEKQSLQDRLAIINLELHSLRTTAAQTKVERDEMKTQLQQMQDQVKETFRLDQEKAELRRSKLRLEGDVHRLREERKGLVEKNQLIERELKAEIERASSEEAHLNDELAHLRSKLSSSSDGRDRELQSARQKAQRLEKQLQDLEAHSSHHDQDAGTSAELSMLQKDLSSARRKETHYLQREATHKEHIRDLKQTVSRLERQVHEFEVSRLAVDTPQSSTTGSTRKTEVIDLRRQLTDTQQQLKDLRHKNKETQRTLQRHLLDSERAAQTSSEAFDQQREALEAELSNACLEIESHVSKTVLAEKTISRLRTRIQTLENSLQAARVGLTADQTMAEERKDLHEMLKDAKLSAEDLQLQITNRQSLLDVAIGREKEMRSQLKRIRQERTLQTQKSTALASELDSLQASYDATLQKFHKKQKTWEEERKKVRFPNMSVSEGNSGVMEAAEKRHQDELKGLGKQIMWLRAKLGREEGFRSGLVAEKRYLSLKVEMFQACNAIDLDILRRMGVAPEHKPKVHKPPKLKVVARMVIATVRMKNWAKDWEEQKKIKAGLLKGLEKLQKIQKADAEQKKVKAGLLKGFERLERPDKRKSILRL